MSFHPPARRLSLGTLQGSAYQAERFNGSGGGAASIFWPAAFALPAIFAMRHD
jgi:hypothetical protein